MSVVCDAVPSSDMVEPASGPHRLRHTEDMTTGRTEKEKRKRSRVTPEQLVHLEEFFATDRSPTAVRRKEISDLLGMQERQTQIWFQNRRAKAKLQDGKKPRESSAETPPDSPPELVVGYETELQRLLHEDEAVTIIPCTDLSVGSWRRIATTSKKHDLVAYLCEAKRCLTWFIRSSGYGFKMEIPFDIIIDTEFTNAASGPALASFFLSQPPTFYLESSSSASGAEPVRYWKKCADWTEDQQATKVLRHNLAGSAAQLAFVLRHLNARISGSDIRLQSSSYLSHSQEPSPVNLEVRPPPPSILAGTGYHYHPRDSVDLSRPAHPDHPVLIHRRSSSLPVPCQQLSLRDGSAHPFTRPSSGMTSLPDHSIYPQYPTIEVSHSDTALPYHVTRSSLSANCGQSQSFSSQSGSHQRPYSAPSNHSYPYEDDALQPPGSALPTPFGTPSPPLLTVPFYSTGLASNICTVSPYDPGTPVLSGLPNSDTNS